LVRYGLDHVGWNVLRFITTKRPEFAHEREVRALIWKPEWAGLNRHVDANDKFHRQPLTPPPPHVLPGLRRPVNIQKLIERVIVSPTAAPGAKQTVEHLLADCGYTIPVGESALTGFPHIVTDLAEIVRLNEHLAS